MKGIKPERVFYYFDKLTKIPRCSGDELEVAKYIEGVAEELGLRAVRDSFHNVIVEKPAQGSSSAKKVILQAHTDMVCVARDGYEFDFSCSPIPVVIDGDWVRTEGTTLGADNGIGVSMMLSIMENKEIAHPNMVFLFTATEETGMNGVIGLEPGDVQGDMLINIDSEEEGYLLTSCAGGINHMAEFHPRYEEKAGGLKKISISGLKGGHSGMEIVKERANSIKLLARILGKIKDLRIASISGGVKLNAIPHIAEATVSGIGIDQAVEEMLAEFKNEYCVNDPEISVKVTEVSGEMPVMDVATMESLVNFLRISAHGILSMSKTIHGLVESSVNLAMVENEKDRIVVFHKLRSSVRSLKYETVDVLRRLALSLGANSSVSDDYPEWQYREESYLREHMKQVWKEMYGKDLVVTAIHAGLECGYLVEKVGDIDMVSIGPDHHDVHTPDERVSISSVERVYAFLEKTLAGIS